MNEPEFVRGNQKTFIRILCTDSITQDYAYKMCLYNEPENLLKIQQRFYNGDCFVYYEVSGMQSLDILIQTKLLKRAMAITIIKAIIKLCRELSEYVLDVNQVIWDPKYILVRSNDEDIRFMYSFLSMDLEGNKNLESLVEFFVENLDYQDEQLVTQIYQLYDILTEQKEQFVVLREMEKVLEQLVNEDISEEQKQNEEKELPTIADEVTFHEPEKYSENIISQMSEVHQKERRYLKRGVIMLLTADASLLFWWLPVTWLKLFFIISVGIVLVYIFLHMCKQDRQRYKEVSEEQPVITEEYHLAADLYESGQGETCIISLEDKMGMLIHLQYGEPQNIYINEIRKIIGKDQKKAQEIIDGEGISRMHAMVYKMEGNYIVEDLNSTNGTMVNGKLLEPRYPYILQEGDKVCFACMEYVFRR